ncbi:MAG: methyl-accepting chemotaxis protein [Candidatus Riflebacteria bacterium]|nr:methyl-accepting chemotaxis protein [Candidatus Riflebacteria bacterium]
MKLGMKVVFAIGALVAVLLIMGYIGYNGMVAMDKESKDIALNFLPSISSLGVMNEAQTAVQAAQEVFQNDASTDEDIQVAKAHLKDAWERADKAWKIYEPLPRGKEEDELWKKFVPVWNKWKADSEEYAKMITEEDKLRQELKKMEKLGEELHQKLSSCALEDNSKLFKEARGALDKVLMQFSPKGDAGTVTVDATSSAINTKATIILLRVKESMGEIKTAERTLLTTNLLPERVQQEIGHIASAWESLEQDWKEFEGLSLSEGQKNALAAFQPTWNTWRDGDKNFVKTSDEFRNVQKQTASSSKIQDQAAKKNDDFINVDLAKSLKTSEELLNEIINLNEKYAADGVRDSNAASESARRNFVICILVALIVAFGMGFYINRNISEILNGLFGQTQELINATLAGKLDKRCNTDSINFEFREIGIGVNRILDAIIGPLNMAAEYVDRISKGDVPRKITENYLGDFNEIKNNINMLIEAMESVTNSAKEIAGGNLTTKIQERSSQDELMKALSNMIRNLSQMIRDISSGVQTLGTSSSDLTEVSTQMTSKTREVASKSATVATASEEMSANASSVAVSMEQATTNLTTIATATEEMTSTISEIAGNSEKARTITTNAVNQANQVSTRIRNLGKSAQEIGKFTETISSISAQTNILALNATIEAARAGAAGRGFAVVANEIKELAKQAAAGTEDIKAGIAGIQSSTDDAIVDIDKIAQVIREVSEIVSAIATAIEEQTAVTKQIAGNIAQASTGVRDSNQRVAQSSMVTQSITKEITFVSAAASELEHSGTQVDGSAKQLSQLAERLKGLVSNFRI